MKRDLANELAAYWEKECRQRLSMLRDAICLELAHNLQEARLSLDKNEPNVAMALSRFRQMEEVVRKLKAEDL